MNAKSPKGNDYIPFDGYRVATVIYQKGEKMKIAKRYFDYKDQLLTLGELSKIVGFDPYDYITGEVCTIILDSDEDGTMWKKGHHHKNDTERQQWYLYGETLGRK